VCVAIAAITTVISAKPYLYKGVCVPKKWIIA
jgi:hypothetical protein